MEYQHIRIQIELPATILTINRPKALNALNRATFSELRHFFSEGYKEIENTHGVIITGAGEKAFVAGADIKEFLGLTPESASELSRNGQEIFSLIENFHKPVIAAINGFALGGGCELAMACHLRLATKGSKFGQPEVNLGIIPGYGGTQRLQRYIGKTKAMELLLTAEMISAEEALALGLVNRVVDADELMPACKALVRKISKKGPLAVRQIIACVNAYDRDGVDGFTKEYMAFGNVAGSEDFIEGAKAFIEKRAPQFKGR